MFFPKFPKSTFINKIHSITDSYISPLTGPLITPWRRHEYGFWYYYYLTYYQTLNCTRGRDMSSMPSPPPPPNNPG